MGSLQAESDYKNEFNDSGFAQDEPMMKKQHLENGFKPQLLDLSDDVLLYILKYCDPIDLKSLGYTCSRLGALVLDRTLWERVDARSQPVGPERLRWFLTHGLSSSTTELLLSGYAREAEGCLGHMNCEYKEVETMEGQERDVAPWDIGGITYDPPPRRGIIRGGPVIQIYDTMPRATCFPLSDAFGPDTGPEWAPPDSSCPGPQYTLTQSLLRDLEAHCPAITSLALEYCNIDCTTRNISHFPRCLKKLSLRGSKCFNQALDKSFLFKIQDYLTKLEELNVSECDWIEPSSLLPLSKLPALRKLYMRRCRKITECVAYSSLATRYGFKKLQVIDLRESPVGDSEVSSFGWVLSLEELYVSPPPEMPQIVHHAHYVGDVLPEHIELDPWEEEEPEYFKAKQQKHKHPDSDTDMDDDKTHSLKRKMDTPVVCTCGANKNAEGVAVKKSKSNGINEGASTSKWSPTEDPPPLRYFNGTTFDASVSVELIGATKTVAKTNGNELPSDSDGIRKLAEMKKSEVAKTVEAELSGTSQASAMESTETTKSSDTELTSTLPSSPMESSDVTTPEKKSPSTSAIELSDTTNSVLTVLPGSSQSTKSFETETFGTLQSSSMELSEFTKSLKAKSDTTTSSIESSENSQSLSSESPSTPQASSMELSETTKSVQSSSGTTPPKLESPSAPQSGNKTPDTQSPCTSQSPGTRRSSGPRSRSTDPPRPGTSNQQPEAGRLGFQRFFRFRQNQNPEVIEGPEDENRNQEPIHKILYVNVGRRLHTMYRLTMPVYAVGDHDLMGGNVRRLDGPYTPRLDPSSLVSDTTVHRFGRADSDNISYINIGPNGIQHEAPGARPDRSNLRVLSMTGFRNITNRSLIHLATAAPMLRVVDFTGTRVTERGVHSFRCLRPDCEVIFDRDT